MSKYVLLALICVLLGVSGQVSLKYGVVQMGGLSFSKGEVVANLLKAISSPYILLGLAFYGAASLLWLEVLSHLDLSVAYPLASLGYVFSLIIGALFFQELVNSWRVVGVVLIVLGAWAISQG